jgi:adenylate kinase
MIKKLILIIGAPGSGKTTDSAMITKKHSEDISNISVGKLISDEISNNTSIGKIMKKYVNSGDLIPSEIIMHEVFDKIKNASKNIVLMDGFARGIEQLKSLGDTLFHNKDIELVAVIEIKVSKETSKKRVLKDNSTKEEIMLFEYKLEIYEKFINEIENFYKNENKLKVVNGENNLEQVVEDIDEILERKIKIFS